MPDLLLSFYGDDFTGSSDAMEALASHGVPTVLFTRQPTGAEFEPFADYRAIGLAGSSRSRSPAWMDEHLTPALQWLAGLNARFCHYKVCSTFDSSPTVGSIGKAIDIGRVVFAQSTVPLIVGVPQLRRYTAFGNLFAAYQGTVYRIDRHPVMSRHPVTPMHEADLRLHLAAQTATPVVLHGAGERPNGIVLIDVADAASQLEAGRLLLEPGPRTGPFVVGSSGVEYALLRALVQDGAVAGTSTFAPVPRADRVIALSGSCSPTTERQIGYALANGFQGVAVDPVALATSRQAETDRILPLALAMLAAGCSPLIHTALGPATDTSAALDAIAGGRAEVGTGLGAIARALIERTAIRRVLFAGGDTSSHALAELDIFALTTRYPLAATPGSPLCTAHSGRRELDGIDLAMKGGQLGGDDYFVKLRDGIA